MKTLPGFLLVSVLSLLAQSCSDAGRRADLMNAIRQTGDLKTGLHVVKIDQLYDASVQSGHQHELIYFLQRFMIDHPTDPYRAYETYLIATAYQSIGETDLARLAFDQSLHSGPDVTVQGESIQRKSLQTLLGMEADPYRSIELRETLLDRYGDTLSRGQLLLDLGFLYETVGDYRRAYDTFKTVLTFPVGSFATTKDPLPKIRERIALYDAKRDWGQPSLETLVRQVKQAIRSRDTEALVQLQAKINFFSMSWLQERADPNAVTDFDIRKFSLDTVTFEDQLEANSNAREAFLKTSGWSTYIPIWYMYFRKVDFPADPEYNGTWEWVGVYFGDTIQEVPLSRGL